MKPLYKRKRFIIPILLLLVVIIVGLFANSILANYVKKAINEDNALVSNTDDYRMTVDDVDVNIFGGSITLHRVYIEPTEGHRQRFKEGDTPEDVLKEIYVDQASCLLYTCDAADD